MCDMHHTDKIHLLELLGSDPFELKCCMCGKFVSFADAVIMPSVGDCGRAFILCKSALCFAGYIDILEETYGKKIDTTSRGGPGCKTTY